jgi:hypothetical protein
MNNDAIALPHWLTDAPETVRAILGSAQFLPWFEATAFDLRTLPAPTRKALGRSGVYAVAIFEKRPTDETEVDPLGPHVRYIGMTKGARTSLKNRVTAFATAARGGIAAHSGGYTWRERKHSDNFWIAVAPTPDFRTVAWNGQCMALWPELIEKALLFAYADRHGVYPSANKEGWSLPVVSDQMVEKVSQLLVAPQGQVGDVASAALPDLIQALGYAPRSVRKSRDTTAAGAQVPLSMGYQIWLGRSADGVGRLEIWKSQQPVSWFVRDFSDAEDIPGTLADALISWVTGVGMV